HDGPRPGVRGLLQRLRRPRSGRARRVGRDRLQSADGGATRQGLVLPAGGAGMSERYDVIVVGSGAGGGVIAGELAERGRRVLLMEAGPYRTAADFTRWE